VGPGRGDRRVGGRDRRHQADRQLAAAAYLYAAADQAWGADGGGGPAGWRGDRTGSGGEFRFAVLLAEAATARFVAGDGYLSNRQLASDLRHGAAWLATGALLARQGASPSP